MYKPRFSGPIHQVVKPKEYKLYSESDVDTFVKLKKLNDQIDALKLENEQLQLLRNLNDQLNDQNDALKLENEQLLICCKGQGAGSRRFRKHARVRKGTAYRKRRKNRK